MAKQKWEWARMRPFRSVQIQSDQSNQIWIGLLSILLLFYQSKQFQLFFFKQQSKVNPNLIHICGLSLDLDLAIPIYNTLTLTYIHIHRHIFNPYIYTNIHTLTHPPTQRLLPLLPYGFSCYDLYGVSVFDLPTHTHTQRHIATLAHGNIATLSCSSAPISFLSSSSSRWTSQKKWK